jgi:hypothetical protein
MTRIFISLLLTVALLGGCDVPPEGVAPIETTAQAQDHYPTPSEDRAKCYADCLSSRETCENNPSQYPGVNCDQKYLECVADYCDEVVPIVKAPIRIVAPVKAIRAAP